MDTGPSFSVNNILHSETHKQHHNVVRMNALVYMACPLVLEVASYPLQHHMYVVAVL